MSKDVELTGESKVWIFVADRQLSESESGSIGAELSQFADNWLSHGKLLKSSAELLYNRFLFFAADEEGERMCGRAIDAIVRFVKELEARYSVSLLDRNQMAYVNHTGKVQNCKLTELNGLLEKGEITSETKVFNNMVSNKNQFEKEWLVPLSESWQLRYASAVMPQLR